MELLANTTNSEGLKSQQFQTVVCVLNTCTIIKYLIHNNLTSVYCNHRSLYCHVFCYFCDLELFDELFYIICVSSTEIAREIVDPLMILRLICGRPSRHKFFLSAAVQLLL